MRAVFSPSVPFASQLKAECNRPGWWCRGDIEEKKKVVVREPSEQEEQLGLEEEEMVGEQSGMP